EEEKYQLKNESLKIYSNDYDTNLRRLKIMTNTLVGDVEVIRV
ncbi:TPA: cell wall-active antibiotics response protein, partial [Enterococcus faecalis]|nr:cell wall-active antibiotics response protein [Enterococcus faecalis]